MSNDDEYEDVGLSTSPLRLALAIQKLRGDVTNLKEDNTSLTGKIDSQAKEILALKEFKAEFKTGAKILTALGSFTIFLIGLIVAFVGNLFSGKGFHWFTGS